jgi:hypothetical protein
MGLRQVDQHLDHRGETRCVERDDRGHDVLQLLYLCLLDRVRLEPTLEVDNVRWKETLVRLLPVLDGQQVAEDLSEVLTLRGILIKLMMGITSTRTKRL